LKIYIASSWKNENKVLAMADILRDRGYEVFAFVDPEGRPGGYDNFVFHAGIIEKRLGRSRNTFNFVEFVKFPESQRAFKSDKAGLDWADTCILLLPSGRSSHIEAGYAKGQGKKLYIYGSLPLGEFDCMYGFADGVYNDFDKMMKDIDSQNKV
jgi:hypothetical protein